MLRYPEWGVVYPMVEQFLKLLAESETSRSFTVRDYRFYTPDVLDYLSAAQKSHEIAGAFWENNREYRLATGETLESLADECIEDLFREGYFGQPGIRWYAVRVHFWYQYEGVDGISYEDRRAATPESLMKLEMVPLYDEDGECPWYLLTGQDNVWCLIPVGLLVQ